MKIYFIKIKIYNKKVILFEVTLFFLVDKQKSTKNQD